MKKFLIAVVIIAAGFISAKANEAANDPRAEKVFAMHFTGAQNVKWTELKDGYLKVSFTLNGVRAESYFNEDAELIATVRNVFYSQLPLPVIQTLSNRFANAVITEITEISNEDDVRYKVVFQKGDKKYSLLLGSHGDVIEQQKIKTKK